MAAQAGIVADLHQLEVGIVHVPLTDAVTGLAAERLVLLDGELFDNVLVTFGASLPAGVHWLVGSVFKQGLAAVKSVLVKRLWGEKGASDEIAGHDGDRQQYQTEDLGWHLRTIHNSIPLRLVSPAGGVAPAGVVGSVASIAWTDAGPTNQFTF